MLCDARMLSTAFLFQSELLHFEMDEKKLDHFLKSLYEIRDEISLHSKDQH